MSLSQLFFFCTNHSGMGGAIEIIQQAPTTTTPPPLDECECGSLNFPVSGNLIINGANYSLLHDKVGHVGQRQTFITGIDRISNSGTYVASLSLDFSEYPVYVSHGVKFTLRTLDHKEIAFKNVGVDDRQTKITKPIKFTNLNDGIDLYNKVVLLDVDSICDDQTAYDACCDKMPSYLSIQNGIDNLKVMYGVPEAQPTTTTTTTTLAPPPPPPTDPGAVRSPVFSIQYYWTDYGAAVYGSRASAWNWTAHNPSEESEVFQDAFNLRVGEIFTPDFGIITEIITARIDNSWLNDIAATSTDGFHGTILFSVDSLKPDGGSGYQTEFEIANARSDLYDPYLFARFDRNQGVVLTNRNSELSGNSWFVGENIRYPSPNFLSTVGNTSTARYRDTSVTRSNRTVTLTRSSPLVQPRNDKVELLPIATTYNYRYRGVVIIRDDGEWKRSEYVYFEVPVTRVTFEVVSRVWWFLDPFNPIREP